MLIVSHKQRSSRFRVLFMKTTVYRLLAAVAVIALLTGCTAAATQTSNENQLVFTVTTGESTDVYTMQLDGTRRLRLTNDQRSSSPAVSPDGKTIAFVSMRDGGVDIYTMLRDGSQQQRLTSGAGDNEAPAWSPDSRQIAFVSDRDDNREIYTMNADGSKQTRLTTSPARDESPAWSPDGQRVAFVSTRDAPADATVANDIYVLDVKQGTTARLTTDNDTKWGLSWAPDGSWITFSAIAGGGRQAGDPSSSELFKIKPDGSGRIKISPENVGGNQPSWSPRGTQIAFSSVRQHGAISQVYVMQADGTGLRQITQEPQGATSPGWLP